MALLLRRKGSGQASSRVLLGPGATWEQPWRQQPATGPGVALEPQPWSHAAATAHSHCTRLHQTSTDPLLCRGRTVWVSSLPPCRPAAPKGRSLSVRPGTHGRGVLHVLATQGRVSPCGLSTPSSASLLSGPAGGPCFVLLLFINKHLLRLSQTDHCSIKSCVPQNNSTESVLLAPCAAG